MDNGNDRRAFEDTVRGAFTVLVGEVLPAAATCRSWPVWTPDGFARLLLDHALGAPWETALACPRASDAAAIDLIVAIEMGERLLDGSACIAQLNRRSVAMRARRCAGAPAPDPCQQAIDALLDRAGAAQRHATSTAREG